MIIVLNNKSNFLKEEFDEYINKLRKVNTTNNTVILCPSSLYLEDLKIDNVLVGAQNVSSYSGSEYTGDISAQQLKNIGVSYCIVGHSERRKYDHETNDDINKKIKILIENNITPILCIGEEKEEKNGNMIKEKLESEIKEALRDINTNDVIIAYEPIWAIGTGIIPTPEEINEVITFIKEILPNNKILYGGSVTDENINIINSNCNLDGYLLGRLSVDTLRLNKFLKELS